MVRIGLAAATLLALSTPAFADGGTEVCVLTSTETRTAPKKPNIFETALDCGTEPTDEQAYLADVVNNAMNTVDALEAVAKAGYEIEAASWRDSYTGREIIAKYTLVREGDDTVEAVLPPGAEGDEGELPEATEPAEPEMEPEEEAVEDFSDDPEAEELDL